jgi:hypothetical protein
MMPMLVCRDAAAEIGAMIMIEAEFPTFASRAPRPDASSPVVIYIGRASSSVDKILSIM